MSFGNDAVERSVRRLGGFGRAGRTYLAFEALDEGLPGFASLTGFKKNLSSKENLLSESRIDGCERCDWALYERFK